MCMLFCDTHRVCLYHCLCVLLNMYVPSVWISLCVIATCQPCHMYIYYCTYAYYIYIIPVRANAHALVCALHIGICALVYV